MPTTGASLPRRVLPALAALAVYAAMASAVYANHWWLGTSQIPNCACDDQVQEVWFLAWPAFALPHGHNPLLSAWLNYPAGANLAANTSMPLLGVLAMPVTWLFGPVATYNLLARLAFCLSAFSMCLVLRRWTRWWPAAFAGGLVYGFSPYMIGQGFGHVFLSFAAIPPLIVLALDEVVVRRRLPWWASGGLLGLLCFGQFLISPEVLVMTVLAVGIGLALLAAARWREVRSALPYGAAAFGCAVGVAAVLLAYPVWVMLEGLQHIVGPLHPLADLAKYPGDVQGIVTPTTLERFAPHAWEAAGARLTGHNQVENGEYLGIPLVVLLVALVVAFRKRAALVLAAGTGVAAWVLSLGARLTIHGDVTTVPLPFAVLRRIPFVQDILPVRFSLLTSLCAAGVLAIGLDTLRSFLVAAGAGGSQRGDADPLSPPQRRWRAITGALALLIAAGALVPLVPRFAYTSYPSGVAALFSTSDVHRIPAGSVVLTYPYPSDPENEGMLDQAVAGMRYKILGGEVFTPGPGGKANLDVTALHPPALQQLFAGAYAGDRRHMPDFSASIPAIRSFLRRYHVSTVVVYDVGAFPGAVVRYLTAALGPPTRYGGVTEFFDVPTRLGRRRSG